MKLTIDTKHDSKDEILKAIKMLYGLVHDKEMPSNMEILSSDASGTDENVSAGMMSMFGSDDSSDNSESSEESSQEEKDDEPQIILEY